MTRAAAIKWGTANIIPPPRISPSCVTLTATLHEQDPAKRWWLEEPMRLFQTNVQETSSSLGAKRFIAQISDFSANTLLFNMGGIVAQYPTKNPFHCVSEYMPRGRDLFQEVLEEAHARQIRVIGRFDRSKAQKPVLTLIPNGSSNAATVVPR